MAQWNKDAQEYRAQDTTNFEVVMIAAQTALTNLQAKGWSVTYNP